ncbi:L-gulonolactone/D-arabinono-1,4-lactone oxidase [Myriangium duriaei CBS 260.36]|uniref:D-arabinono-1,4-lactone oxidase n=1 Tax=Myriangium duriaei CBS 260.36 TaxID=1168546 RepID=A0A9P4MNQ5_9PEZI|nr:L-gulonolactone/D-arabinono-1,4-lactone oxidase [Myriangium duriaei CBS 260.36]
MHPVIEAELAELDVGIPFRAQTDHLHNTWARTFHCRPELYIKPQTIEEVQKIVRLARRCQRRIVIVGCGHSPSDLTLTSSWVVNLDDLCEVVSLDKEAQRITVQAGIRLKLLNKVANSNGLTIPNLGSIDEQSLAGAIATGTHGSTLRHGTISEKVSSLRIVLSDGSVKQCSPSENEELFRASLVSLGALGIVVEIEYQLYSATNIEWTQTLVPLQQVLDSWSTSLWTQEEFVRVWWLPYLRRAVVWSASKTDLPPRAPETSWYGGSVGFHTYHILLRLSNMIPRILPWIEWFVFGMQYSFKPGTSTSAVESMQHGLLMNCLYSQFVNEWAVPLSKGPEIIARLDAWLNREPFSRHRIPFDSKDLYVHAPIEVRVSDTRHGVTRPYLDMSHSTEPTLYLNATLYRPYLLDPPCKDRYYAAFEWLMREYNGRPHWAKNFTDESGREYLATSYGADLDRWLSIRDEADPDGIFLGAWHRRNILPSDKPTYRCEEHEVQRTLAADGGRSWIGEIRGSLSGRDLATDDEKAGEEKVQLQGRNRGQEKAGLTGTRVFDKM